MGGVPTPLADLEETPLDAVADVVERARVAQKAWAATSIVDRIRALARAKSAILGAHASLGKSLAEECGKPLAEAVFSELVPTADVFDWWLAAIEDLLAPVDVELSRLAYPGKSARTFRGPRGVVALITPWNYPVALPLRTLVPALLSGNAVVWKPSEHASRVAKIVADALRPHLPEHVLSLVLGGGKHGERIIDAGVDAVVFTGGTATGRKVLHACADRVTLASVELGGKDAAIVLEDARLDRTAAGVVWGAFTNAGQNCASIERVYVVEKIADAFIAEVVARAAALEPGRDVGPLTTRAQAELVQRHVDEALAGGAKRLTPPPTPSKDPRVIAPVVLRVEDERAAILEEETFGPVLPIVVVPDEHAALDRVRRSRFALTTSIWTRSIERLAPIAATLPTPVVTFNAHGLTGAMPEAPWSGARDSGFGVTNGSASLSTLTVPRFVLEDRARAPEVYWYPYTDNVRDLAVAMVKVRGGAPFFGRVVAVLQLGIAFVRRAFERSTRARPVATKTKGDAR